MMSDSDRSQTKSSLRPALIIIGALLVLLIVSSGAAYGGFVLGQSRPRAEVAQVVEPTAIITTTPLPTVTVGVPTATADVATETATAAPTYTPTAAPVTIPESPMAVETEIPTLEPGPIESKIDSDTNGQIDLGTFYDVWRLVEREFDGELPADKERLYGAISGSLDVLDDEYTRFIRPEIAERLRQDQSGVVSGIGAIVRPGDDGHIEIVRPIDDQPADLAGLLAGDVIIAVDGQSLSDLDYDEIVLMLRGPAGTTVTLTILREGETTPLEYAIVRAEFEVPLVETNLIEVDDGSIAYIKLNGFMQTAEEDVSNALTALLEQNPHGIIFDLRDNGGGFLDQSVAVADLFLPEGIILYERSSTSEEFDETFRSESGDFAETLPLVVLVNAGSASAAEIVAGAIQDNGRGILIGENTFGKGSVQHVHTLNDGSELRITIARWFTPDNRSISEDGIAPDIEVQTPVDLGGDDDPQLQRALEYLKNGE